MRPTVDAARWIYSKLPDSSTTQMEKLRQRTNQNLSSPADTVAASSPETPSLPLPASDRDFVKYIQEQQARSSLPPGVSALGENTRFGSTSNQPALPVSIIQQAPSDQRNAAQYPNAARQLENAAQLYPDAKSVLAAAQEESANRKRGFDNLALQGAAPSGSLDSGVMARTAATRTEPDGTQYEQRQYALPGGGEVSGWRAVDPNRPKGSFSVVPGLSDFEKRRYAELVGEERRQAAYQAGQGRQYDALLAKQAEQQVEWNKARLGQENQDRDYEIKRAQLQQSADQNRMNASKSGLEARQKEADAITAALGGVDKMPQYQDYEKLFYERNPAAKKEDVLEGVLAPLGVSALDPTGKNPQDLPGQYLDKAKGVIALRGPDGKYREYSPNEYIRLLNQQRAMEQARLIAQTRAQLYGPQNP
jgi:hypothetical protein